MGTYKPGIADAWQVNKTPSLPKDVVRLSDLNTALADVPTVGQLSSDIADISQPPTEISTDIALTATLISPNSFQLSVNLAPNGIIQAAQTGLSGSISSVSAWTQITLGYQQVSAVVITGATGPTTGILGTDYYLDSFDGIITITPNANLIGQGVVTVTFNCAEIDSGGGLEKVGGSSGGLEVNWGAGHNQVPTGDAVANLEAMAHLAAAPDPATQTTTVTFDRLQRLRVEVNILPGGGIDQSSGQLEVNVPQIIAAVEAGIPPASSSNQGFMTAADYIALQALGNEQPLVFGTTGSIALSEDQFGNVTGNVITGPGITVGYVTAAGNSLTGTYDGDPIWFDLSLSPTSWPAGWPNVVYWAISNDGTNSYFYIYQDSGGSTLLASGQMVINLFNNGSSPIVITLYNPSSVSVATLSLNTTADYPVYPSQSIVLTPQGVSMDLTTVALKTTTDAQQAEISTLQTEESSTGATVATIVTEIAALQSSTLSSSQINDFNCLETLLEKWEYAHILLGTMRLENGDISGNTCPMMIPARQIIAAGSTSAVYTMDLQIRGVSIVRNVWPATYTESGEVIPNTGGRAVKNGMAYVVTLPSLNPPVTETQDAFTQSVENQLGEMIQWNEVNTWTLTISDDGTGNQVVYHLNSAISNGESLGGPQVIDYTLSNVTMKGGATVTLATVSGGTTVTHLLVVPNVPPYPSTFGGYFMQVDALDVQDTCSLGDTAADGNVDGIAVFGRTVNKDLDTISGGLTGEYLSSDSSANGYPAVNASPENPGFNGIMAAGTDGTDEPKGNGLAVSTANQPIIDVPRDLLRLGLMDGGNANDWVWDILCNGNDIWVSGAFDRWGNIVCPGLARLDHLGRLSWSYINAWAGFSEPVRHLALTSDGNILAASIFPSMYQNQRSSPVHKILWDGTEDTTFNCPSEVAINDNAHPNLIIDVAGLSDGKVAVLTPRCLTVLNADGSLFGTSQQDSDGTDMFLALLGVPGTTSLLLSSHAWSSPTQPCDFGSLTIPRGLKLLNESTSNFQIDGTWANPAFIGYPNLGAGTGAMASCMRAIAGPNNAYFIAGNGLTRYNGIDTSWNTQLLGNLIEYSEAMNQTPNWRGYGSLTVTESATVPAGVSGNTQSAIIANTGGVGYQAFLQQSVAVAANTGVVLPFYLKKQVATNYAIVQLQFAGSSSGASSGGGGGAALEAYAWLDPAGVNQPLVISVAGAGNPQCTMVTAPTDSGWWLVTFSMTNSTTDTDCNVTFFPAYSTQWDGTSMSTTGSIQISAPSMIYSFWSPIYVPTTGSQVLPSSSSSNAAGFQGLYKILGPGSANSGAADPTFNCDMTYSGDDGMAIPFALDGYGNIYCGGPISSIKDSVGTVHPVTPWMVYKLNSNGQFLEEFNLFDDAVLVARITPYGNLACGGKFNFYGAFGCGHFCMINPVTGALIRDPELLDVPFIASSSTPDTVQFPGLVSKTWEDLGQNPPGLYVWSKTQDAWVQSGVGGYTQLSPVSITDSPAVPPSLWVPGESGFNGSSPISLLMSEGYAGASIWYTEDGSDPRIPSNPARTLYPSNASVGSYPQITTPTIVTAYATAPGYTDSVLSQVIFGQQLAPPVINPASENISFPVAVTITGPAGAAIWYTTDGSNPATSGTAVLYTTGFNVGNAGAASAVVMAVAKQTGYFTSTVAQASYGDNIMPGIVFTPAGGASVPVSVVISLPATFTASYTVYYTTSTTGNPAAPTLLSPSAPGPLTLNLTVGTAIQAFAAAPGWTSSPISGAAYGLSIVNAPTITPPPAGSGFGAIIITADPTGPAGQSIVYTVNGGAPITALSPAGVDLSDIPGVNGVVTVTAYSTFPGWANSPTATSQIQPLLLSGLIDVNFAPASATPKVGRMAIFSNPFEDVWNVVGATPGLLATIQENFYSDGTGTAQAPGATVATQLQFTPGSGTFGVIPFIGDNAYKNFLQISGTSVSSNVFESVAFDSLLGLYVAVSSAGQIYTAPDGVNWTQTQSGLPQLTRAVYANMPAVAATSFSTTFTFTISSTAGVATITFPSSYASGYTVTTSIAATSSTFVSGTTWKVTGASFATITLVGSAGPYPSSPVIILGTASGSSAGESATSRSDSNNNISAYSGLFVVGAGIVMASQDGVNWTNITANLPVSFDVNDISVTSVSGVAQIEVVGSAGRQFSTTASTILWSEITPSANLGANLNSKSINNASGTTAQYQLAVGDAGTIFNVNGATLALNAYDEVPFMRAAVNPAIGLFAFVSAELNGVTETYTMTTTATPVFAVTGDLPAGVTNLLDITPFQYGFIAVGDKKILLGQMVAGVLAWSDITPTYAGGTSSMGGSSWGSGTPSGDEGPQPFNFKGVTVNPATGLVVVCGDQGIIYGIFNGMIWIWEYSNQIAAPVLPSAEVLRGTFSNLTPGFYDLLIYGHGNTPTENSTFHAYADGVQVKDINGALAPSTVNDGTYQNTNWQVDRQYVDFSDLETYTGTIAFGLVAASTTTAYLIETVNWIEYGNGNGSGGGGVNPTSESAGNSANGYSSLGFSGGWPIGWPETVYVIVTNSEASMVMQFYFDSGHTNLLASSQYATETGGSTGLINILANVTNIMIGQVNLLLNTGSIGFLSTNYTITGSNGFGTLLGGVAQSVSYSTTSVNPDVPIGSEIFAMDIVGNLVAFSGPTIPPGLSSLMPGGTATTKRNATRSYLVGILNSASGFINAVQLSRRKSAGTRMGLPVLAPESLDNLPFPAIVGGSDLFGVFLSNADLALGIAPISQLYYSIVAANFYQYEAYLTGGAGAAGISADPTPQTGVLYSGPLAIQDNGLGVIVRAIAVSIGRTNSNVAVAFYWPKFPESSSWGQ
jgi:hypothetical protein